MFLLIFLFPLTRYLTGDALNYIFFRIMKSQILREMCACVCVCVCVGGGGGGGGVNMHVAFIQ